MDNEFRKRILAPVLMLVGPVLIIAIIAFSISRVLLAVPEVVATFTALAIATYVLFLAMMVGKRTAISGRALGAGLAIGLIALLGAGLVSAQAGMRELHHGEEETEGEGAETTEETEEIPDDALLWVAVDIDFSQEPSGPVEAGEHVIAIDNQGNLPHNVTFVDEGIRVDADAAGQAATTVTLEPGTYEYICDVPGHAATMSGTLEVN